MYPGYDRVKNGGTPSDLDRRKSGGPFGRVVGHRRTLHGAYRNDHICHRIVSKLAARRFQSNVKQCRDKLEALKRNIKWLSTGIGEAEQAWSWTKK